MVRIPETSSTALKENFQAAHRELHRGKQRQWMALLAQVKEDFNLEQLFIDIRDLLTGRCISEQETFPESEKPVHALRERSFVIEKILFTGAAVGGRTTTANQSDQGRRGH